MSAGASTDDTLFAPAEVNVLRRADGCILLTSPMPVNENGRCLGDWLVHFATTKPDTSFLMERGSDGAWAGVTYAEALREVRSLAAWLLRAGCSLERPLAILCDNSVRHALLALAAMHVGIPVCSVSSAYSLLSTDFGKLRSVIQQLTPGAVYVADAARFAGALAVIRELHEGIVIADRPTLVTTSLALWPELTNTADDTLVDRAFQAVKPDTVAKLLFTSGSTGSPKAVITTQRMLVVNQEQMAQIWSFLNHHTPILVDWLPWSHTFGGSHNFNLVLRNGGTLYIDAGRPAPQKFAQTLENLRETAPTLYFNVPRGFDMLLPVLRDDAAFRKHFFSRLRLLFCGAAALPQHIWSELKALSKAETGRSIALVTGWGSTETAPLATSCYFEAAAAGVIGLPIPGVDLKLVPLGPKFEVRVKGPNVTPGYWRRPDLGAQLFDSEGFYLIGDAVRPVDAQHYEKGLLFDGRVSEDFKLSSGTWVNAGSVRLKAIAGLAPLVQDAVVTGHNRDELGLLLFPNVQACRQLCSAPPDAPLDTVLSHPEVRQKVQSGLAALRTQGGGSSTYATRALLMTESASIDAGEITDKGYINQRIVLERRASLVESLYSTTVNPEVIFISS